MTEAHRSADSSAALRALCDHPECKGRGTYAVNAVCTNCDWAGSVKLTKGHEFSRWSADCPRCGCRSLTRKWP